MRLFQWKLWCPEHAATLTTNYIPQEQGPPTCCPLNSEHTNISGVAVLKQISTDVLDTRIIELDPESGWDPNAARTRYDGFVMEMEAGENDSTWDRILDVDVQIVSGEHFMPDDDPYWTCGDRMSFMVIPPNGGIIGALIAGALEGAEEIVVSPTVLANARTQWYLIFTDGATFETEPIMVKGFDVENSKVLLYDGLPQDLPAGTYVGLRIIYLREWPVYKGVVQRFAADTPGAAMIPAGWTFRATYHHEGTPTEDHHRHFGITEKYMPVQSGVEVE